MISYVDKSQNNYVIICKKVYHSILSNIINSNRNSKHLTITNLAINNKKILVFHKLLNLSNKILIYPYLVLNTKIS